MGGALLGGCLLRQPGSGPEVGLEAGPARRLRGRPRAGLGRGGAKPLLFYKSATSFRTDPPSSLIISLIAKPHLFGSQS